MAEASQPAKKFLPCLLDRLTDGPELDTENLTGVRVELKSDGHRHEGEEAGVEALGITPLQYRTGFRRDLRMLLNTKNRLQDGMSKEFPEVERSVFNFGMPDPAGRSMRKQDILEMQRQMREAILRFEPRLVTDTVQIRLIPQDEISQASPNTISFEISGTLWASPLPEYFQIRTEINLENGRCVF